jgi:predicted NBD/HSP70 family sugar kinase
MSRLIKKSSRTELSVLQLIQASQPVSRVELAERSGLGSSTITGVIGSLMGKGLIIEELGTCMEIGRKRLQLKLHPTLGYVVGIDLGTFNLRVAITDLNGAILGARHIRTQIDQGREKVLKNCFATVRELLVDAGISHRDLLGIGVAFSGVIDVGNGVVLSYPRLGQVGQWRNVPLGRIVEEEFRLPCIIEDSVRAVATSEKLTGAGVDFQDFVYVDVGMGVGAAIFINGHIYRGFKGSAGEFGHMTVDEDGPLCCCGSNGCLEAVASGATVINFIQAAIQKGVISMIHAKCAGNLNAITLEMVAESAGQNDSLAYRALSDAAKHIGAASADLVNLLNPEAVIFGGAMFRAAPDLLLDQVRRNIRQRAMEKSVNDVVLAASKLSTGAGALGIARLMSAELVSSLYKRNNCILQRRGSSSYLTRSTNKPDFQPRGQTV